MNHKRRRSKNRRAGCLLCKPHKMNGAKGSMKSKAQQQADDQHKFEREWFMDVTK